jgi:hypothetical protein
MLPPCPSPREPTVFTHSPCRTGEAGRKIESGLQIDRFVIKNAMLINRLRTSSLRGEQGGSQGAESGQQGEGRERPRLKERAALRLPTRPDDAETTPILARIVGFNLDAKMAAGMAPKARHSAMTRLCETGRGSPHKRLPSAARATRSTARSQSSSARSAGSTRMCSIPAAP